MPSIPNASASQVKTLSRRDFLRGVASFIGFMLLRFDTASAETSAVGTSSAFAWDRSVFTLDGNDNFRCDFGYAGIHTLKLVQVRNQEVKIFYQPGRISNAPAAMNYVLVFRGPRNDYATQGTFQFSHPELGAFLLFVVPGSADENGQQYVAVINNLTSAQTPHPTIAM